MLLSLLIMTNAILLYIENILLFGVFTQIFNNKIPLINPTLIYQLKQRTKGIL